MQRVRHTGHTPGPVETVRTGRWSPPLCLSGHHARRDNMSGRMLGRAAQVLGRVAQDRQKSEPAKTRAERFALYLVIRRKAP